MVNMENLMNINRKLMMAGREKDFDDGEYEKRDDGYTGKSKYRKMFQTPTAYKDFEKDAVKSCLEKELPIILRDFEESYKTGNYPEPLRYVLGNKRFIKALKKRVDDLAEGATELITLMLSEQLLKNKFVYGDDEIKTSYEEVFFRLVSKKFEKFMNKFELDEKVAKALFINNCMYDKMKPAHVHQRVFNVLAILYEQGDKCDAIKIFEKIFRDYYTDSLLGILLESRSNQGSLTPEGKKIWSQFTNYALDEIETKMEKDDIRKFLKIYIRCLKGFQKRGDHLPRISLLNNISGEMKINKQVKKIIEKDESDKKYFM